MKKEAESSSEMFVPLVLPTRRRATEGSANGNTSGTRADPRDFRRVKLHSVGVAVDTTSSVRGVDGTQTTCARIQIANYFPTWRQSFCLCNGWACPFSEVKVKGKGHPITGHEGPEGE